MSCEQEMSALIHKYLDGETTEEERKQLYNHLHDCSNCHNHFKELKKTIAFVQSASHIEAPADFTANVLSKLPEQKKTVGWRRWMKNNPMLVAASLFIILMTASVFSVWMDGQKEVTVSGHANVQIDKESRIVKIPSGEVVEGDLVIRNGTLQVDGEVKGNVLIINGEQYLASAGSVSGEIEEINQALDWIWYNIKGFFKDVFTIFNDE